MDLKTKIDALATAVGNLVKGRQPLSSMLTTLSGRDIGVGSSTSILDRSSGDGRYNRVKGLAGFCSGKPAASEVVAGGTAPYAFTLSASDSKAVADIAATASTVFSIQRNGTQIGTITFAPASTTATFNYSSTTITLGQKIRIVAPSSADSTLANIDFLLASS